MKKIHIIGIALVAVFAFSAFAAASAFAVSEWLVDGAPVLAGEKIHVEMTGTLILEDMGKGSPTTVECTGSGLGVVLNGGLDIQEEAVASSCKTLAGTCGTPLAVALNTPWTTEIVLVGAEFRDLITGGTGGEPGYEVTCFGIFHDSCVGKTSTGLENMSTETPADVLSIFTATLSEAGNCTLGGAGEGLVVGEVLVQALEGLALAVS
jgi:hypothetical protein